MRSSRSRLLMVGCVAAVAVLSVGATAYAAEREQSAQVSAEQTSAELTSAEQASAEQASAVKVPTASHTPRPAAAAPTAMATADAAEAEAAAAEAAAAEAAAAEAAAAEAAATEAASAKEGVAGSGSPTDGNVIEVRTPNPAAVPNTPAEHEYFYGLVTDCMSAAGYDWHGVWLSADSEFAGVELTQVGDIEPEQQAGFTLALYGDTGGGDYYHWADAGCWGYAVHVTGNDGNN